MQMIDVLKRLSELDSLNPAMNKDTITENTEVSECGESGMITPPSTPSTPASLNITAASGEELGDMLAAIMKLAGVEKVDDTHMGAEHDPSVMTADPVVSIATDNGADQEKSTSEIMRSFADKLHPEDGEESQDGEEETDESWDNTPGNPNSAKPFDSEEFANHENQGGQGQRMSGTMPQGITAMEQKLWNEYQVFING